MNMTNISKIAQNLKFGIEKNSPSILTALGVLGTVSTVVLAVKATPKALRLIADEELARADDGVKAPLSKVDIVKVTWKAYIPSVAMGAVTISCIIGANSINLKRNAILASAYTIAESTLSKYQEKLVEVVGKNKEEKVRTAVSQDEIDKHPISKNEVFLTGSGEHLFYDSLSGRYFKNDMESIRRIENDFNKAILGGEGFKSLNELYYEFGLAGTEMGEEMGWTADGIHTLNMFFDAVITEDGRPCIVIHYEAKPKYF